MTPRPYQLAGRDFLASRRHALLADEMRVGKTAQAILAAEAVGAKSVIVVCPAIAVPVWRAQWPQWASTSPAITISYDHLRNNADTYLSRRYDVAIVDECHFAKNPEAQRTKLIYGKGGLGWCAGRLWALSGTPAPKHAGEVWPLLRAFGVIGADYHEFIQRYCVIDRFTERVVGTKASMIPEVRALLAKVMLRRTRAEVAPDMPAIGFEFLPIDNGDKPEVSVKSITDQHIAMFAEDTATRQEVALAKVDALVDNVEFAIANGLLKQTVVFGWHKAPLNKLYDIFNSHGIRAALITGDTPARQREAIQVNFRNGLFDVVVANILAAGTAIDLSAARHGYFLELDWVGGNNLQAANRLISLDKSDPVTFDICTMPGTIDDAVQRVLVRRMKELKQMGVA